MEWTFRKEYLKLLFPEENNEKKRSLLMEKIINNTYLNSIHLEFNTSYEYLFMDWEERQWLRLNEVKE